MDIRNVNKLLSEAVVELMEVSIGQTVNNDAISVHRFSSQIRVTDLSNAGKRGKIVDQFALYDLDSKMNPKCEKAIEQFAKLLEHVKDYKTALKMAHGLVAYIGKNKGSSYANPKIQETTIKGVKVAPAGFKQIKIDSPNIVGYADIDGFRVTDRKDVNNEQTLIPPSRAKASAIKAFYAWAKKNEKRLKSMTFGDVSKELSKNNIGSHYYCAMD